MSNLARNPNLLEYVGQEVLSRFLTNMQTDFPLNIQYSIKSTELEIIFSKNLLFGSRNPPSFVFVPNASSLEPLERFLTIPSNTRRCDNIYIDKNDKMRHSEKAFFFWYSSERFSDHDFFELSCQNIPSIDFRGDRQSEALISKKTRLA